MGFFTRLAPSILLLVCYGAVYGDWYLYFRFRNKEGKQLERYLLLFNGCSLFCAMCGLSSHGGLHYCFIAKVYHSNAWLFSLLYLLGSAALPFAAKYAQLPYSKRDWIYWAVGRVILYLIIYLNAFWYFWFIYAPTHDLYLFPEIKYFLPR
jgi:hypothetical protein